MKGAISRPNHALTPGDVVTTDASAVCAMQVHGARKHISFPMQAAVLDEYGYTTPAQRHKYILNYLVPWGLGGACDEANIWPAAVRGTGFYQKIQAGHELRALACRGELSLRQAQTLRRATGTPRGCATWSLPAWPDGCPASAAGRRADTVSL
jgi:hypothetical protein